MSDDVTITVRVNNQTANGFRDINGQLRTLDGRFASSANQMRRNGSLVEKAFVDIRASLLSLAPAAVPVAASLVPIAVQAGAAGLAVGAFGLAVKGQLGAMKAANDAQAKYSSAVAKHGATSKEAAQAEGEYLAQVESLDPATRKAAAGLSVLTGQFQSWSKSLAGDTMPVVTKGLAVAGALLPKLTPMVKGAAGELDRLMTVAGGAVNTSAFDALSKKVSDFANSSLKSATDKAIHFMRVLSEGNASGPLTEFMAYAKAQGPAVRELLGNLVQALGNIAQGAADAGPGLLTIVNAFAKLVASVPPELIGNLMQVYAAFKLIKLAGAGIAATAGGFTTLAAKITALRAASVAAGGGIAGLKAAFLSLGATAKASVIVGGLALVALGIKKLADGARGAPPDIDKLTSSLKQLASTGKFTGELKKSFGDVDGLIAKFKLMQKEQDKANSGVFGPKIPVLDDVGNKISDFIRDMGVGHESLGKLKDEFGGLDKTMAQMVGSGYAKQAAKDFEIVKAAAAANHVSLKDLSTVFPEYTSAVADAKWEQQQAAEGMGLFGTAAQAAATKLDQQKASADGLRGAIQALNDVQRAGLGGMIGFEAAIDAAAKAAKDNHGALTMTNGVLNLNSEKARNAASALQDLADKTDAAAGAQREAGASWETVNGIYSRGRDKLVAAGQAMGLTKDQAQTLAAQLLKIPTDVKSRVSMDTADAKVGIEAFNAAVRKTPGTRKVTLETLSGAAERVLEAFGYKVRRLPNGKVQVTAATGGALSGIRNVATALAALRDKTVSVTTIYKSVKAAGGSNQAASNAARWARAAGGLAPGYAAGGEAVQTHPDGGLITGPGTGTSDSIVELSPNGGMYRTSNREYIVKEASVRKYGVPFLDALNSGRLKLAGFAKGGHVSKTQQKAREQAKAEAEARSGAMGDLTISHFGWMAGYRRSEIGNALGKPDSLGSLVSALNQWRNIIMKATHGSTESRLLKQLDSAGRSLLKWEKQLTSVTKSLEGAKSKLSDLKNASAQLAASVKGNLLSSTNITRGAGPDSTVTLGSIQSGMRTSKDKVTAFATALKQLRAKGFSKSIIQQVAEAGIDGGGLETASALLQASASEVKTINDTQAQIESAAGSAGKTAADAVYDKAIKAQERYVKSLEGQQKKLQHSMDTLGQRIEKAIESVFGKGGKKAAGGIVGAAASGGLRSGLTLVGEQGPELADLPMGSRVWSNPDTRRKLRVGQAPWASMLTAPRRTPAAAAVGAAPAAGDSQPIVIQLRISDRDFGELWVETGRKAVKTRGSIEATLRPPRGR
ncbi:phage minor tail protein [Streptomyces hygroscopicus subsp. jinggangensis 5008]|nr:phage minor tail protein [Streptomyces hygroscopicus subsp. jinggangensis 5008]AGF64911.1 phage minor tail protein [Streptomyces hygroscopicus subsp. jinggangensis TL01]